MKVGEEMGGVSDDIKRAHCYILKVWQASWPKVLFDDFEG
jgi:hypothetical protein